MFDKSSLREQMLDRRMSLDEETVKNSSQAIINRIINMPDYDNSSTILAYYPFKNEIDTIPIINDALKKGKRVGLPVTFDSHQMSFYEIWDISEVKPGRFGVMEPDMDIPVEDNDAFMIVPGVAFDMRKNRIGFGAGFYDIYLDSFPDIYTCALAYDFQVIDAFETEEHDKAVDIIVTESQLII
mgnify:CR=1 FL=1